MPATPKTNQTPLCVPYDKTNIIRHTLERTETDHSYNDRVAITMGTLCSRKKSIDFSFNLSLTTLTFKTVLVGLIDLDLSHTNVTYLPDLINVTPNLKRLRCINTKIHFINCDFPEYLHTIMLDNSHVKYISDAHIPRRKMSLTGCKHLKGISLRLASNNCLDSRITLPTNIFGVRILQKRVSIDKETIQNIAARKIQLAMKRYVIRVKAAKTIQRRVVNFLYGKVFNTEEYFLRVVLPDVFGSHVFPKVNYTSL